MNEKNYKPILVGDVYQIEYEYYNRYLGKFVKGMFKDWNGNNLVFCLGLHAQQWILARIDIMSV